MRKLKIVFDSDGVLANTQKEVLNRYNKEYGLAFTLDDITSWHLSKVEKPGTNMSKYFLEDGFFASLAPMKGAKEIVKILSDMGDELFVATSSPVEGLVDKVLWVRSNFPQIPEDNICLITRKDLLWGDIILDDGLHNLSAASSFNYPIVYDQPWNKNSKENLIRVHDWYHFFEIVQKIRAGYTYEQLLERQVGLSKGEVI